MSFILNPYIHSKKQPNTFIGGIGATITNRAQLVAKLTGIVESDIKNFNIDDNNNVSCYIGKDFNLITSAFEDDTDITFFYNTDGRHKNVGLDIFAGCTNFKFYSNYGVGSESPWATGSGMFEFSKVSHVFLENATVLRGNRTFGNISNTKIYIPNIISTNGVTSGANNPFAFSSGLILYMNENYDSDSELNARVNAGLSSGNIAQVIKITDFTTPDSVNDLSVSDYGATYIKLDFTPIAEADFYEVWIKKSGSDVWELFGDLPDSKFLLGLDSNTTYQIKLATCDEFWNGSGFFSDPNKRAFSNTITQTTASTPVFDLGNLVSYWDLRTNANDQWGSNNGTATGVSFVSGGIAGDCADFGSGTSNNITVADDDTLSFGNGTTDTPCSFNMWVNFSDLSPTLQVFFQKRDSGDIEYQFTKVDNNNFRLALFDATTSNRIGQDVTISISANTWYMVTLVYDGINQPTAYVNASNTGASNNNIGTYVAMHNTGAPLLFGKLEINTSFSLNGKKCEISIWKKALTAGEVSDIYSKNINGDGLLD